MPWMRRALALAERGGGATSPNPMVGCVLVDREGAALGEGWHARAGTPHAEVVALEAAARDGRDVRRSTAVVTLEPCAHQGRTPPCADRLVEAGVTRVVYAVSDPHAGKGGAVRLREAGVETVAGVEESAVRRLLEPWLHFQAEGRPFFHLKTAQTLSGHLARGIGSPRWITSPPARARVHRMRRRHRAVMAGIGTVLADDPELTVRKWPLPEGAPDDPAADAHPWPEVQPLRVVLDSRLRTPVDSRLVATAGRSPVLLCCRRDADPGRAAELAERGVEIVRVPPSESGIDLEAAAGELARREVTGVLVEPGPRLAAALVISGLVDRWTVFLAPDAEVAEDALPVFAPDGPVPRLTLASPEWSSVGPDGVVTGRPVLSL